MDISDFHELMEYKYAEREARAQRLWATVVISVSLGLVILVLLWYGSRK